MGLISKLLLLKDNQKKFGKSFFDFKQYSLKSSVQDNELIGFGIRIFSIGIENLDNHFGAKRFKQWLANERII